MLFAHPRLVVKVPRPSSSHGEREEYVMTAMDARAVEAVSGVPTRQPLPASVVPARLLNSAEVADLIRVPEATLRYWRHIGIGPKSFKMGPRRVLYLATDVTAWVDEQYADQH